MRLGLLICSYAPHFGVNIRYLGAWVKEGNRDKEGDGKSKGASTISDKYVTVEGR